MVNFCKNFFANFRLFSPAQDAVFVNLIYIIDQWKSNVQFFITAPCWQQFFREVLRCLTSIKLFLNPDYHGKHCYFDLAFNSQKDKIRSLHYFFCLSLKSATLYHLSNDNIVAAKNEAILHCKDFEWSSFMCLLGLSLS